jgi:2'-5' RNA ligase
MSTIRSFLALPTSDSVKDRIAELQAQLKQLDAEVKWDSPEKFHITLKFLGNVEAQVLEKLISNLEPVVRQEPSFDLEYEAVGAFPNLSTPRVIWIGAALSESLVSLHRAIEDCCSALGFAREERAFHPHLTLGRVKGSRNIQRLTEKLKTLTLEPTRTRCAELLVMRSELRPSGSLYSVVKSIPLKP